MMNCSKFKDVAIDYLYGELSDRDYEKAEAHLTDCPSCRRYVAQMGSALESVRKLPSIKPLQTSLDSVMREARESVERPVSEGFRIPKWVFHPAFAIVLVSLFVGGTIGFQKLRNVQKPSSVAKSSMGLEKKTDMAEESRIAGISRRKGAERNEGLDVKSLESAKKVVPQSSLGAPLRDMPAAPEMDFDTVDKLSMGTSPVDESGRRNLLRGYGVSQATGKTLAKEGTVMREMAGSPEVTDLYQLGVTYQSRGDYTNAISNFTQVIEVSPEYQPPDESLNAYLRRGLSNQLLGYQTQAIDDFRKSMEVFPGTVAIANQFIFQATGECLSGELIAPATR